MKEATILKPDLSTFESPDVFDEGLHKRFLAWKDRSGKSLHALASMMKTSQKRISQYIVKEFIDFSNLSVFEKDIANFLKHYDRSGIINKLNNQQILETSVFKEVQEVFQLCRAGRYQGMIIGPSGIGKTTSIIEFCRRNSDTAVLTCHVSVRTTGVFLGLLSEQVGTRSYGINNTCLTYIIDRLKAHPQFLIVDEAHFLKWEMLELLRTIYDASGIGMVLVGQPELFDKMRGKDKHLYDQILSRIPIKRRLGPVAREDVKVLADSLCPGLDKKCIDFLYERALRQGRIRAMINLLEIGLRVSEPENETITINLLKEVAQACGE